MARYVDIEKEITDMQSVLDQRSEDKDTVAYFAFEKIIERLKKAPAADVVEVVRCAQCEFQDVCKSIGEYKGKSGYCSKGKPKEGE